MASQLSAKLNLDVTGYKQGVDEAKKATEGYKTQLGDLSKKFPSMRKELGQTRRAILDMENAWRSMSDAQKSSFEGQQLYQQLTKLKERGSELVDTMGDVSAELRNMASDTRALDVAKQGFDVLGNSVSLAANAYATFTGKNEDAKRALTIFATVQSTVNTLTGLQNALQKQSSLMLGITTAQQKLRNASINLETAAKSKNIVVTKGATAAQWALNVAADANPYVLLISALVAAGVALVAFTKYAGEAAEKEKKQREETEKLKQAVEEFAQAAGNEYGKLRSSYEQLKKEWNDLSSAHEKSEWLKKNKKDVDDLTNSVHDVISADKFFNDETGNVIKSFKLRAQAAAAAALATKYYQKSLEASLQKNKAANVNGSLISVETYNKLPEEIKKKAKPNYTLTWEAGNGAGQYGTPTAASSGMGGMVAKNVVNGYTLQGLTDAEVLKYGLTNQRFAKDEKEFEKIADMWIEKEDEFDKQVVHKPVAGSTTKSTTIETKVEPSPQEIKERFDELTKEIKDSKLNLSINYSQKDLEDKRKKIQDKLHEMPMYIDGQLNIEWVNKKKELDKINEMIKGEIDPTIKMKVEIDAGMDKAIKSVEQATNDYREKQKQLDDEEKARIEAKKKAQNDLLNNSIAMFSGMGQAMQTLGNEEAAQAMQFAATSTSMIADIAKQIPALLASTIAKGTEASASVPFPGNLAAMAAVVADVMAIFAALPKFAGGGIITGPYSTGDRMLARVNAHEMILNNRQQSNLFNAIDQNKLGTNNGQSSLTLQSVKVRGADLYLTMKNYENMTGKKL